jgi:hypothetical protein
LHSLGFTLPVVLVSMVFMYIPGAVLPVSQCGGCLMSHVAAGVSVYFEYMIVPGLSVDALITGVLTTPVQVPLPVSLFLGRSL